MVSEAPSYSAIIGCGPSGCFLLNLLRQSQARAKLIAIDDDSGSLELSAADQQVLVRPGEKLTADIGSFEAVFVVFDPSEGNALTYARDVTSRVSAEGAYVYAVAINTPGSSLAETDVASGFGGMAIVDAAWVLEKRGDSDQERALHIAFNFAAHMLTFLTGAIDSGDLSVSQFKEITSAGTAGFAATHVSEAESVYAMTMSKIDSPRVRSGFVFIDAGTGDVMARRIFLRVAAGMPRESNLTMLRVGGLAPFKIMAMLVH
ncbi:hypothetical protein [Methanocella sp. MCL-LM]|uniref:hypothetical protein n=1 Tax=Methanocella sp. MCL-LM TaxID=3412035 RepID=UPI003C74D314